MILQAIRDMLKKDEYNIYDNENVEQSKVEELAKMISLEDEVDLISLFPFDRFSSKRCWKNLILLIKKMDYPSSLQGLPVLFEFLQDINWPIFEDAIQGIMSYSRREIVSKLESFLIQAHKEEDEMWISGLWILGERIGIKISEFRNIDNFKYFQERDI